MIPGKQGLKEKIVPSVRMTHENSTIIERTNLDIKKTLKSLFLITYEVIKNGL